MKPATKANSTRREARLLMALLILGLVAATLLGCADASARPVEEQPAPHVAATSAVAAGEYLTIVGGCNDCHTAKWKESFGNVPADDRLTGMSVGFQGPWGTSYPANLRLSVQGRTSAEWIAMVRGRKGMPPMPWMNLHGMADRDLAAIYAYLSALGPKGSPAPAYVPPGQEPRTPYFKFEPIVPKAGI
jgi:mono/diheme cytochrome c family protein